MVRACLQIPLSQQPKTFDTFTNLRGLFPFALHVSSDIFQVNMDKVTRGFNAVLSCKDGAIIFDAARDKHDPLSKSALIRLIQRNDSIKATK